MIDFYKYSFLSVLGKSAGSMSDIEYPRVVINKYDKYLLSLKEMKEKIENNQTGNSDNEIYL